MTTLIVQPNRPVYLDYAATTPVDQRVAAKMIPYLSERFGNPASRSHAYGWAAEEAVELAREQVALLIGADPREIVWTSGATESNNLAIKGAATFYKTKGRHLIALATEHKAVLDTMREMEREGWEVTVLPVMDNGLVDIELFKASIPACPQCGATALDKCVSAPQAPGKSAGIIKRARARAAAEGHMSNYSQGERGKLLS